MKALSKFKIAHFFIPLGIAALSVGIPTALVFIVASLGFISESPNILVITAGQNIFTIVICLAYLFISKNKPMGKAYKISKPAIAALLALLFALWLFGGITGDYLAKFFNDEATLRYNEYFQNANVAFVFLVAVFIGPIAEELLLRGVLYTNWAQSFGIRPAIYASAAVFSLMHGTIMHLYFAFVLGLIFAYVYQITKDIRMNIVLHMVFNAFGVVMALFDPLPFVKDILSLPAVFITADVLILGIVIKFLIQNSKIQEACKYRKQTFLRTYENNSLSK